MSKKYVFTYWEGMQYPFTSLCLDSVSKIFGSSHVHITEENLDEWIDVPQNVLDTKHLLFRSDYIRALLLKEYGGWWFDSDVILLKDPSYLVLDGKPQIWNLIYRVENEWKPLVNCGILYSPRASTWINKIVADFEKINPIGLVMTKDNEDIGQDIFENWSVGTNLCKIGSEYHFNSRVNVDADYRPFWDGSVTLETVMYGLHIGASLSRWAAFEGDYQAHKTLKHRSIEELLRDFPDSFVAQYIKSLQHTLDEDSRKTNLENDFK